MLFSSTALDDPIVSDEQAGFRGGQVSFQAARKLKPDECQELVNCDITLLGDIVTRRGIQRIGSGPVVIGNAVKGLTLYNTNSQLRLVATTGAGTYFWAGSAWTLLAVFPHGVGATGAVRYAQGINKLYFCDGVNNIWSWDGTNAVDLGNALATQPPAAPRWITWHTNRLCAAGMDAERDAIYFSQFLDGATWDKTNWQIRVGAGEDDKITGLVSWSNFNLVVLKQKSIWIVNCDPTVTPAEFTIKCVHRKIGCTNPDTAVQVGSDIFFLSDSGVRSLKYTLATEEQSEVGEALSSPVQDIIQRASTFPSFATYWNNRYILSITVDAALTSYCLVYNTLVNSWSGYWTGLNYPSNFAYRIVANSPDHLVFANSSGEVMEWLDFVARADENLSTYQDEGVNIPTTIRTRALDFGERLSPKTGLNVEVELFDSVTANGALSYRKDASTTDTAIGSAMAASNAYGAAAKDFRPNPTDLQNIGPFRELSLKIASTSGRLGVRSVVANAFLDTIKLQ